MSKAGSVLVVAAHPDDEVLGCGGTIARMADEGRSVHVLLLADGENSRALADGSGVALGAVDERNAAAKKACQILGCKSVECLNMPDNRLDTLALLDIVKEIEKRIKDYSPRIVMTHHSMDVNVDHRIVNEAVIVACRPTPGHPVQELLFFEIMSSSEWRPTGLGYGFEPNYFVDITATLARKNLALDAYSGEMREYPHPRSKLAIKSLASWRGATVGVTAAEAFIMGRKIIR